MALHGHSDQAEQLRQHMRDAMMDAHLSLGLATNVEISDDALAQSLKHIASAAGHLEAARQGIETAKSGKHEKKEPLESHRTRQTEGHRYESQTKTGGMDTPPKKA